MVDRVLRGKVEVLLLELRGEGCSNTVDLVDTQNPVVLPIQTEINNMCRRIEQDRVRLQQAMCTDNPTTRIETINSLFAYYSSLPNALSYKKFLLDEPHHLIFLTAFDAHPTKEMIEYLIKIYREIDPTESIFKAALTYHPDMLQRILPKINPDALSLLLNTYKEAGCLATILFSSKHMIFTTAVNTKSAILKIIIAAYKEADPTLKELRAAIVAYKSRTATYPADPNSENSDENEKKTLLLTLYQEFNTDRTGMHRLSRWQSVLNTITGEIGNRLPGNYFTGNGSRNPLADLSGQQNQNNGSSSSASNSLRS